MDNDGNGTIDQTLVPDSILNADQAQDLISPVSTSTFAGIMGSSGFYRSDVDISLSAEDPIVEGIEEQTSGLFKTLFSLDGGVFEEYAGVITITGEGEHTLKFYSIDNAGNQELEQTINFAIDKTPPRFFVTYDPDNENFRFEAEESEVSCTNKDCTATDNAGNITEIFFKQLLLKNLKTLTLDKVSYNDQSFNITNNLFTINLLRGKFNQLLLVKNQEIARIEYNTKQDVSKIFELQKKKLPQIYILPGKEFIKILIIGSGGLESDIE